MNPEGLNLDNWREPEFNRHSFYHVDDILPVHSIATSGTIPLNRRIDNQTKFELPESISSLQVFHEKTYGNAMLIAKEGEIIYEWYRDNSLSSQPHILFSVSKSITAMLAGLFVDRGDLDPDKGIIDYLPAVAGSAYADATLQQLLDMTISMDFEEEYLGKDNQYARYRRATGWNLRGPDDTEHLAEFLYQIPRAKHAHGSKFAYRSPNSDLLGLVIEKTIGESVSRLLSKYLFEPVGAIGPAYINIDGEGTARTAGGICCTAEDLLRLGELMRNQGQVNNKQIISEHWVTECTKKGDREAWIQGDMALFLPEGRYRNKWYQDGSGTFLGIGIHGQWLYVNPETGVTISKFSSYPTPMNDELDLLTLEAFNSMSRAL
ncbi:MAG: CubicO group peptidase (beta-lactamase class C family) [Gammaproteobacteria bacterium]|jgi:CubicO group peptidase (beta-lactamase class C family)